MRGNFKKGKGCIKMQKQITEAQIYFTRMCNLRCGSCNLALKQLPHELTSTMWQNAFKNLELIGIKTLKIMGGEPTTIRELPELLRFLNEETILRYVVLSNSLFPDETFHALLDAKMQGYFTSVDGIDSICAVDTDADKKSRAGFQMLKRLRDAGIKFLGANIVITRKNLQDIPEIVRILSSEGFWVNLCPIIYSRREVNWTWEYRTKVPPKFLFSKLDLNEIRKIMSQVLNMRNVKLAVPYAYLENMARFGIRCNWMCRTKLSQLRVDADGSMLLCNDISGKISETFNILNMTNLVMFKEFRRAWRKERKETKCPGCYWSSHFCARDNLKQGRLEFDYFYNP